MIGMWHADDEEEGRQGNDNHLKEFKSMCSLTNFQDLNIISISTIVRSYDPVFHVCTLPFQIMVKDEANRPFLFLGLSPISSHSFSLPLLVKETRRGEPWD